MELVGILLAKMGDCDSPFMFRISALTNSFISFILRNKTAKSSFVY